MFNQKFKIMLVQFAAFLTEDLTEKSIKKFEPSEKTPNGSVVAEITVAEAGKEKKYHTVKFWGREGVHQYLKKGKCLEVKGDMTYNLAQDGDRQRKYYSIENADITLLGSPQEADNKNGGEN